jgi:hypothetical protein
MSYDLVAAVEHIVHDYSYLMVSGHDTQKPLDGPYNHYAERTFLVHCRSFAEFLMNKAHRRDMCATDFVDTMPPIALDTWNRWHDHIDKHLMHLSQLRVGNPVPWTGSCNKPMLEEFIVAWGVFYRAIKPSLKPEFDKQLEAKQKQMPQVKLR